jgi:hypothetical protein
MRRPPFPAAYWRPFDDRRRLARRVRLWVLAIAGLIVALVAAYTIGLYRGIDLGIDEAFKVRPAIVLLDCPAPIPVSAGGPWP